MRQDKLVSVILPLNIDRAYSYLCSYEAEIGSIVSVNFANKIYNAIVINIEDVQESPYKLKQVKHLYEEKFTAEFLSFMLFFAHYTLTPKGLVATLMLRYFNSTKIEHRERSQKVIPNKLSETQKIIAEEIVQICRKKQHKTILLEGVTGSGKTEIYFEVVKHILAQDGQILVLLPEIALTKQFLERFAKLFGFKACNWYGSLAKKTKQKIWQLCYQGQAKVVIGARSALFLPFKNLQLIIVDEEHDSSYKQEENIFYNARDIAIVRAKYKKIPVILSSATPSVETMVNAMEGKYKHFILPKRFNDIAMPVLKLVDLNKVPRNNSLISPLLLEALEDRLQKQEQSILFLGRRGYVPLTRCKKCGYSITCPYCSVYLVYHKLHHAFLCHYCEYKTGILEICPQCQQADIWQNIGCGVERVYEELQHLLPEARLILLSKDSASNMASLKQQFQAIESGEIDIIIGTQLISKGHNFSKVSLVGVINADTSLHSGDPRATERTYQTLVQVTGRAGRTGLQSTAIIQSYAPQHPTLQAIISGDQKNFYEQEIKERRKTNTPPFSRFASLIISAAEEEKAKIYAQKLRQQIPNYKNIAVFGPAQAPIALLRNQYRYRILLKAEKTLNLQAFIKEILNKSAEIIAKINLQIDIDPQSFF